MQRTQQLFPTLNLQFPPKMSAEASRKAVRSGGAFVPLPGTNPPPVCQMQPRCSHRRNAARLVSSCCCDSDCTDSNRFRAELQAGAFAVLVLNANAAVTVTAIRADEPFSRMRKKRRSGSYWIKHRGVQMF